MYPHVLNIFTQDFINLNPKIQIYKGSFREKLNPKTQIWDGSFREKSNTFKKTVFKKLKIDISQCHIFFVTEIGRIPLRKGDSHDPYSSFNPNSQV